MDSSLNYLDVFFLAVLLLLAIRGAVRGFLAEIAGVVGVIGGVILAGRWYHPVSEELMEVFGRSNWVYALGYVLVLIGFVLFVGILARLLSKVMSIGCIDAINHVGGAAAGLLKGVGVVCIVGYAVCLFIPQSDLVRKSRMIPLVQKTMNLVGTELPRSNVWRRYLPDVKMPASS